MKVKKGDNVIVITGKDRGSTGKILHAFPKKDMVLVEGVNIKKRHQRATKNNPKGQIVDKTAPIHVSNVKLIDSKTKKKTKK